MIIQGWENERQQEAACFKIKNKKGQKKRFSCWNFNLTLAWFNIYKWCSYHMKMAQILKRMAKTVDDLAVIAKRIPCKSHTFPSVSARKDLYFAVFFLCKRFVFILKSFNNFYQIKEILERNSIWRRKNRTNAASECCRQ